MLRSWAAEGRECRCLRHLLSFDSIPLGLGRAKLSFKLSSLSPGSFQGSAGASPFLGSSRVLCPCPVWSFYQIFPWSPFWLPLHLPHSFASHLVSTADVSAEEFPPHSLSPPTPLIRGSGPWFPGGGGINPLGRAMLLFPAVSVKLAS